MNRSESKIKNFLILVFAIMTPIISEKNCFCAQRFKGKSLQLYLSRRKPEDHILQTLYTLASKYNAYAKQNSNYGEIERLNNQELFVREVRARSQVKGNMSEQLKVLPIRDHKIVFRLLGRNFYVYYGGNQPFDYEGATTTHTQYRLFLSTHEPEKKFSEPNPQLTRALSKTFAMKSSFRGLEGPIEQEYNLSHYFINQFEFDICINFYAFMNKFLRQANPAFVGFEDKTGVTTSPMGSLVFNPVTQKCKKVKTVYDKIIFGNLNNPQNEMAFYYISFLLGETGHRKYTKKTIKEQEKNYLAVKAQEDALRKSRVGDLQTQIRRESQKTLNNALEKMLKPRMSNTKLNPSSLTKAPSKMLQQPSRMFKNAGLNAGQKGNPAVVKDTARKPFADLAFSDKNDLMDLITKKLGKNPKKENEKEPRLFNRVQKNIKPEDTFVLEEKSGEQVNPVIEKQTDIKKPADRQKEAISKVTTVMGERNKQGPVRVIRFEDFQIPGKEKKTIVSDTKNALDPTKIVPNQSRLNPKPSSYNLSQKNPKDSKFQKEPSNVQIEPSTSKLQKEGSKKKQLAEKPPLIKKEVSETKIHQPIPGAKVITETAKQPLQMKPSSMKINEQLKKTSQIKIGIDAGKLPQKITNVDLNGPKGANIKRLFEQKGPIKLNKEDFQKFLQESKVPKRPLNIKTRPVEKTKEPLFVETKIEPSNIGNVEQVNQSIGGLSESINAITNLKQSNPAFMLSSETTNSLESQKIIQHQKDLEEGIKNAQLTSGDFSFQDFKPVEQILESDNHDDFFEEDNLNLSGIQKSEEDSDDPFMDEGELSAFSNELENLAANKIIQETAADFEELSENLENTAKFQETDRQLVNTVGLVENKDPLGPTSGLLTEQREPDSDFTDNLLDTSLDAGAEVNSELENSFEEMSAWLRDELKINENAAEWQELKESLDQQSQQTVQSPENIERDKKLMSEDGLFACGSSSNCESLQVINFWTKDLSAGQKTHPTIIVENREKQCNKFKELVRQRTCLRKLYFIDRLVQMLASPELYANSRSKLSLEILKTPEGDFAIRFRPRTLRLPLLRYFLLFNRYEIAYENVKEDLEENGVISLKFTHYTFRNQKYVEVEFAEHMHITAQDQGVLDKKINEMIKNYHTGTLKLTMKQKAKYDVEKLDKKLEELGFARKRKRLLILI